tara:strand:- start:3531 stop:4292 length:762 start_codon:yes stop_codon:yes gene_type:complete
MKPYINWKPEEDQYLRSGERLLHEQIHDIKYSNNEFKHHPDRLKYLRLGEEMAGQTISGTVLDIGCGNGYSSVHICKTRDIEQIHTMECDVPAVDKLIRANFNNNNIPEELYELILGSFNKIPNKEYYDFVISLGAIHHSSNLLVTMREIYGCLKPGGFFIAHEPYLADTTQNSVYVEKSREFKKVQGLIEIQESERDDHFFRKCEYMTAFYHSGFIVNVNDVKSKGEINNAVMVLKKPLEKPSFIPHSWIAE